MNFKKLLPKALIPFLVLLFVTPVLAYFIGSANLLVDGNMESVGVGDWGVGNGAALTKDTTAPYRGTQNLRVAWGGSVGVYAFAYQFVTVGTTYRVTGWGKSDGVNAPYIQLEGNNWTGTTSGNWEHFDFVGTATSTISLRFRSGAQQAGEYGEFDDIRVVEYKGKEEGSANLVVDGNSEGADTSAWTNFGERATLTKETTSPKRGTQNIKLLDNGGEGNYNMMQAILTVGKTYRHTGWARGDGTNTPRIYDGAYFWSGTSSTDWQYFDVISTANVTSVYYTALHTIGHYVEFDDIRVVEVID